MSPLFRRGGGSNKKNDGEGGVRMVTLVGKPGCHLCDDARGVVASVCGPLGVAWEEKSIEDDAELHREYWEQIPVVLIDGEQHTFWRVDSDRLRRALGG
ncbi:glutaredoxin family protein [Streptomyces sp. NPDC050504]|uniref:glutaredoxin family protein n=1 Tax=Streptomyces sp. NPDC050504 TaxID=3365618 RepID=UPI003798F300